MTHGGSALAKAPTATIRAALPTATYRPSTIPSNPRPGRSRNELCRLGEFYLAIKSALHNCDCQGMFAGALQAGSEAKHLIGIGWGLSSYPNQLRFAYGERSGFIDDEGVNFFQKFESLGVFDEHSGAGSAAYADHDGHGGGESESTGARDD